MNGYLTTPLRVVITNIVVIAFAFLNIDKIAAQPVFVSFPKDITATCDKIPIPEKPVIGSTCLPNSATLREERVDGICTNQYTIKRIWTASDNCGNTAERTQLVAVSDNAAPAITLIRTDLIGTKSGDTLVMDCRYAYGLGTGDVYVEDNCDGNPKVIFKDNLIRVGDCGKDGFVLFMNCSWIATDACGNRTELSVYIKFIDITPPEVWGVPASVTVDCEGNIDYSKIPYFKDFCDGQPAIKETKDIVSGACAGSYTLTRQWVITDVCGNATTAKQTVTIIDNLPPVITSKPNDITIAYNQPFPAPGKVTAKDNCNGILTEVLIEKKSLIGCDSALTRTWTITDACGNSTRAIQRIVKKTQTAAFSVLTADSTQICLKNSLATLIAKEQNAATVPTAYEKIFLLTNNNGIIVQTNSIPNFVVNQTGVYTIHTLIFNTTTYHKDSIRINTTTLQQVQQQTATQCAAIDVNGLQLIVKVCNLVPTDTTDKCIKPIIANVVKKQPDCDSINGRIVLNVQPVDVLYLWKNQNSVSNVLDNVPAGVYEVTITRSEDKTCFITEKIILNAKTDIIVDAPTITEATCKNANGQVSFPNQNLTYTWFDGKTAANRTDLAAGQYFVTVSQNNTACALIYSVVVAEKSTLTLQATILKQPDCAANNGSVIINTTGGSGNYSYSWGNSAQRDNLTAGLYTVTVTDNNNACSATITFVLTNPNTANTTINTNIVNNTCAGQLAVLNITVDATDTTILKTLKTIVVDSDNKIVTPTALAEGTYYILLFDANLCLINSKTIDIKNAATLELDYSVQEALCKGNIQLKVSGGESPYNYDWSDIIGNNNQPNRSGLTAGQYSVVVTDKNGCIVQTAISISDKSCNDTCKVFFDTNIISLTTKKCDEGTTWCLPIPLSIYNQKITLTDNGVGYAGVVDFCYPNAPTDSTKYAQITLSTGKHTLVFTQNNKNNICKDTINVTVTCDNCPELYLGATTLKADSCQGTAKVCLEVTPQYLQKVKITDNNQPYTATIDTCSNGKAQLSLNAGTHTLVFDDTVWGCKKTYTFTVLCDTLKTTPTNPSVVDKTIYIGESFTYCLDTTELNKNKGPYTAINICAINYKAIAIQQTGLCLKIDGLTIGSETLCMIACDTKNRCDTTYIIVHVIPRPTTIDTIYRTIPVGKSDTVCLNITGLANVDTIYNYCAGASGTSVKFTITPKSACIKYEGLSIGQEKGCFVICDNKGKCDTTIVFVTVKKDTIINPNDSLLPVAVNDKSYTIIDKITVVDILSNDTIRGTLEGIGIYRNPSHGKAMLLPDNTLSYTPDLAVCGITDTVGYYIENEHGKDSALVCINIRCQQLIIFNGFSPNGDGNNDFFTIEGIEDYPENEVLIVNRWGNKVYAVDGYTNRNGWDGTWDEKPLPDGTYYYCVRLLKLNKVFTGYVEIRR